ncbi:MAG: VOC family protein [Rhodospirillaceae bacterium]|nr:VOC family protein [Rhodospirillaceae bacterium]MBT3495277.1 VOC family protein [Rhodospirillaceae bacterium]MBT3779349.1 VOC family protein [Rhodospirillaceae bacterium]MBT3975681.1 VOC family protein [Rhodospirillaceae bacterium]MBT4169569.1 VOC family protein [Rhodospirillaceae bacterium]
MRIAPLALDHVVLRIAELDRSLAFYCDVLGCVVDRRRDDLGLYHLRAGSAQIDLVTLDGQLGQKHGAVSADGPNMDHFCLRIEAFEDPGLADYLRGHGLEPSEVAQRFGAEGEGPSLYVSDPDGNVVELKGPAVG